MKALLRIFLLVALAGTLASEAMAQQWRGRDGGPPHRGAPVYRQGPSSTPPGMSPEQRERFRQDMNAGRGYYREQGRGYYREQGPPPGYYEPRRVPPRTMAPEERERLRRDIQDANRSFDRRRR